MSIRTRKFRKAVMQVTQVRLATGDINPESRNRVRSSHNSNRFQRIPRVGLAEQLERVIPSRTVKGAGKVHNWPSKDGGKSVHRAAGRKSICSLPMSPAKFDRLVAHGLVGGAK